MSGAVVLLIVGAVALLAAAVAGGSRGRAIGLAAVGSTARLAIAGVGVMCAVAGAILLAGGDEPKGAVSATIMCELDSRLQSDELAVFIDKRPVGVIHLDKRAPKAELKVTVAKAGRHDYRLEATRLTVDGARRHITTSANLVIDGKHPLIVYYSTAKDIRPALSQPLKY